MYRVEHYTYYTRSDAKEAAEVLARSDNKTTYIMLNGVIVGFAHPNGHSFVTSK